MEHHKVETGTIRQTTNEFQRHTKEKGESYTTTVTHLLGMHRTQFLNHFEISSFTNPTQAFYLVKFEDCGAGLKKRLTSCTCRYFKRHGSSCKHMYHLAKLHSMLVVENPVEHVIRPPDSFFERSNLLALSRANDNVEEEMDEDSESDCDTPVINPLKRKQGANKDLPSLPSCPIPAPANQPEVAKEVPIAIQKASKLLKTADNRRKFASNLSCAAMINFKDQCDCLSMRVQVKCSKVRFSPTASFPGIAVVGCMPTNEISKMIANMLAAAWKSLQRTQSALANVKNKEELIGKSSVTEMDSFKNMAYKILGVIEEGSPDVPARRQLR
ncbi:hypothetical protein PCASD_02374 [Puccinia coronata f. sp. avenae]|uniref:SWIM-type domain-containing protein n=1 Tax=Puccinia coronata f. sp. avenae TaxID=200324 RepID=A0A2N5T651_9BASI|nr:hypothetical protein PCASD_13435 [Puccinia coronata f. sp. avenae]PLW47143.1 hypothetical protein PCASD_02374 [Puccinia coronata f. sp. avenae]